jgi:hypothetical protein
MVRARATQDPAGHTESIPITKPVVAETKVTDPGSNPLGTGVPTGGVIGGAVVVEDGTAVAVVVDGELVWELVQAPVTKARPATTTDRAFEGFITGPVWFKTPGEERD